MCHPQSRSVGAAPGDRGDYLDRAERTTAIADALQGLYRYRDLVRNLVLKDLKLKYRGSVLGFVWSLANPLLMILVYTLAFRYVLRIRSERFVFFLMLGLLPWTFFANAVMMSTGAIVDNAGLLKSVRFPRAILPMSTVLFNFAQFVLTVLVFLPLMLVLYGAAPAAPMVTFPLMLALQLLFTVGVAMLLAIATAFFRDVRHLAEIGVALLFWMTPILYQLDEVPERFRWLIQLTPMSPFIAGYQRMFYDERWPEPTMWVIATAYALGALALGTILMARIEDRLTEQV